LETESEIKPKPCGKPGRSGPPGNRNAEKHGFNALKDAISRVGNRAIDGRYRTGRELKRWKLDLVADLGGTDSVSTAQMAVIDLAVKSKLLLDSIDAWLLTQPTLINKRAKALFPVVLQRQQVADSLAKYMKELGLHRRHRIKTITELAHERIKQRKAEKAENTLPVVVSAVVSTGNE
jgi:hypothetical protein